jgi:hypothetical protein
MRTGLERLTTSGMGVVRETGCRFRNLALTVTRRSASWRLYRMTASSRVRNPAVVNGEW